MIRWRVPALAWLGIGLVLRLFAVGGLWDVAVAAWLYPVFLLRFARLSRPAFGLALIWLVQVAAALFWVWQLAVPAPLTTYIACVAFGTVFTLPYLLDRLCARPGSFAALLLFPAAVCATEFAMGTFSPLGTAFGLSAVTQHANLVLLQATSLAGPYLIGFLIGWFATVANRAWEQPTRASLPAAGAFAAVLAAVLLFGALRLATAPAASEQVRIGGITPSWSALAEQQRRLAVTTLRPTSRNTLRAIPPAQLKPALALVTDRLLADTARAADAGARLVLWSENAAMVRPEDEPALLARVAALARARGLYVSVADNTLFDNDQTHLIGPDGARLWTYRKARPIPGLEFYQPGGKPATVVATPFGRIANVICYDADFPALARVDTDILLVPGGDWPGMGWVHTMAMAKLRAIENGYALFRQNFNGWSAAFDRYGHLLAEQDTSGGDRHLLVADVPAGGAATFYNRWGDWFAWAAVVATLVLAATDRRSRPASVAPRRGRSA